MEHQSSDSPDKQSRGPQPERLYAGEVDLTGATPQADVLRDVIGDAIAEADDGQIPEWGARTIARALANRIRSFDGALHQFAVSGRANKVAMARQLIDIYLLAPADDDETREWVNWLGNYVVALPDPSASSSEDTSPAQQTPEAAVTAVGEPLAPDQATRTETDAAVEHGDNDTSAPSTEVERGIRAHDDAFRAFLERTETDPDQSDLLSSFNEHYIGTYASMTALLRELTPLRECEAAITQIANLLGFDGLIELDVEAVERAARETWDIVTYDGKFYAFTR